LNAAIPHPVPFSPAIDPIAPVASPFVWRDPATIPRRDWLYGRHLIRRFLSVTVAPGGLGKSSLTICEAVAMASGRPLLGDRVTGKLRVWVLNLEDPKDELERRVIASMLHHGVTAEEIDGRLHLDSGRDRGLCTATQERDGARINRPVVEALVREIEDKGIDVLIIDPFVSSHRVNENDNGAIDLVAKEWGRVAERCNCAVELVHHTRKSNGEEATSESSRGAVALLGAARSARVLNRMSDAQKADAGVSGDELTYFSIDRDKANLTPTGKRVWRRMVSVELPNGDSVGVAEAWDWPDDFDGVSVKDLLAVQHAISAACAAGSPPRANVQAKDWCGHLVADALGLDADQDRKRIGRMLTTWKRSGALRDVLHEDEKRNKRPCVEVGEWANA